MGTLSSFRSLESMLMNSPRRLKGDCSRDQISSSETMSEKVLYVIFYRMLDQELTELAQNARPGIWDVMSQRLVKPAIIQTWVLINFVQVDDQSLHYFIDELIGAMNNLGLPSISPRNLLFALSVFLYRRNPGLSTCGRREQVSTN